MDSEPRVTPERWRHVAVQWRGPRLRALTCFTIRSVHVSALRRGWLASPQIGCDSIRVSPRHCECPMGACQNSSETDLSRRLASMLRMAPTTGHSDGWQPSGHWRSNDCSLPRRLSIRGQHDASPRRTSKQASTNITASEPTRKHCTRIVCG